MTQNASDVEIANQGFAAFRQDLNDVLEDITTLHSGDTAPSTTYANQWWYETDTDKLYIRNEDNDAWIEILTLDQANDHLATIGASITLDGTGNVSIDSGDFTVDTTTLHVDSTNNRVGIGTTSPDAAALDVSYGDYQNSGAIKIGADLGTNTSRTDDARKFGALTVPHFDNAEADLGAITVDSQSASVSTLTIGGGSGSFNAPSSIYFQTSSDGASAGTTRWEILANGNLKAATNGLGIDFSASEGSGASSSVLDDYEEGTWTPTPSAGTISHNSYYTKIGRLVTVHANISTFSDRTSSNNISFTGLPFQVAGNSWASQGIMARFINAGGDSIVAYAQSNSTSLKIYAVLNNANYVHVRHNQLSSTSSNLFVTVSYLTD